MSDRRRMIEAYIIRKLRAVNDRLVSLSDKFDYKGESVFQSKIFLVGVSIFISVLLWAFVALDGNSDAARTVSANIKYINLPRGFSIYAPTRKVELRIVGKINMLSSVQASDIVAEVDLANLQAGKYNLPIRLEAPSFARIRSWQPSVAEVEIYRHVERTLAITPKMEGTAPEGMVVSSVKLDPDNAVISGPENEVLAVQGLEAAVPLDKLDADGKMRAQIVFKTAGDMQSVPLSQNRRLTVSPTETNAVVAFENEIVGERIPIKVSVVGQPQEGLQVESIKVIPDSVSIRGRSTAVKKMQSLVLPPVDISGLDQNIQLMIPMQPAEIDPDVEITGTDRARVEIRLSKKMGVKTFTNVPLIVEGAEPGKEWKVSPHSVSVTIEGPQIAIDTLGGSSVAPCELYIDVSNIVSKQMELPVLVKNLKKDFQVVQIEPEQILVTAVDEQ
ncbi:CdaR family protein [Cloacibacillus sp.]